MSVVAKGLYPVCVIGVGNMGAGMAKRLCALGWAPSVCDAVPQRAQDLVPFGALAPVDIAQAASKSIATIIAVVNAAQVREVLFGAHGIAPQLPPGHVVLLCPTLGPQDVEDIAQTLAAQGVDVVDAPMSGGPARAREGRMSLMVAGAVHAVARVQALLDALADPVFHISSRPGDGARTKLVNNLLAGINLVGAAEALALAQRLGLDQGTTLDVIERSSGQSWIGGDRMRRAIAGDLAPRAHMTLLHKDTGLALEAAAVSGFSGPLGVHTHAVFAAAVQAGLADLDDAALLGFLQGT